MSCPESLAVLKTLGYNLEQINSQIREGIQSYIKPVQTIQDNWDVWSHVQRGKNHKYYYQKTFAATAETYNLDIPFFAQFDYASLAFSDATAKDIDLRIYDNPGNTLYTSVLTLTTDTRTSIIQPGDTTDKYTQGTRFSFVFANATIAKTVRIVVQVEEV